MDTSRTLLYIDDEPLNLMLFAQLFKRDFDVLTAASGIQGLQILRENPSVQVVICDMKMPQMTGMEFIAIARQEFPSVAYYILSGYEMTEEVLEALNKTLILKYFRKPFDVGDIKDTIGVHYQ